MLARLARGLSPAASPDGRATTAGLGGLVADGAIAGAVGSAALNMVTYLDMAVRARPASTTPEESARRLSEALHIGLGPEAPAANRRSGLGPLLGYTTGVLCGVVFTAVGLRRLPAPAAAGLFGVGLHGRHRHRDDRAQGHRSPPVERHGLDLRRGAAPGVRGRRGRHPGAAGRPPRGDGPGRVVDPTPTRPVTRVTGRGSGGRHATAPGGGRITHRPPVGLRAGPPPARPLPSRRDAAADRTGRPGREAACRPPPPRTRVGSPGRGPLLSCTVGFKPLRRISGCCTFVIVIPFRRRAPGASARPERRACRAGRPPPSGSATAARQAHPHELPGPGGGMRRQAGPTVVLGASRGTTVSGAPAGTRRRGGVTRTGET